MSKAVVMDAAIEAFGGRLLLVSTQAVQTAKDPFEGSVMIYADQLEAPSPSAQFAEFLKREIASVSKGGCDVAFEGDGRVTLVFSQKVSERMIGDPQWFLRKVRSDLQLCFSRAARSIQILKSCDSSVH